MEYRLPALFESLSEPERAVPLNELDRGLRNQLIADMMNSGLLQFSQAAVDEVVKNINTKEKLDIIYKQVKDLKSKLPKMAPPAGSTFKVDTLPGGSLPILNTNKDAEYLTETIYNGLDIDRHVSNIFPSTIAEQAKTPALSKELLEEKKSEIKERIKGVEANSFTKTRLPSIRKLVAPSDFIAELLDMRMFHNSLEEQDQYLRFVNWTSFNFDSLRNFIEVFRKCKDPVEKLILVPAIKEVIRDINASRKVNYGDVFDSQSLLNRLVNNDIFLTAKEKETFIRWDLSDRVTLERKITDREFGKLGVAQDTVDQLSWANNIRDYILQTNNLVRDILYHQDVQQVEPLKSPMVRQTIKDIVQKLWVWGIIDNDAETCDAQYNKCMKWSQENINNIKMELNKISEHVLLFEELTKGQIEFIRASINHYNDFPDATRFVDYTAQPIGAPGPLPPPSPSPHIAQPAASFKYNDQVDTLTTPGLINMNNDSFDGYNTLLGQDSWWKGIWPDNTDMFQTQPGVFDWKFTVAPTAVVNPEANKEDGQFVGEVKKAGVRVAATQLNKVTKGVLAAALPGDQTAMLQQFLDSELGTSFVSMVNGMALTYGLKDNEHAQIMAKEFRISSLTTAGNFAVEEILDLVSGVVADALSENISDSIKKSEEEDIEITYEDVAEEKLLKA